MFEGFPDGGDYYESWNYENGEPPSEPPPKWWEWLIALGGLAAFWVAVFDFLYGS